VAVKDGEVVVALADGVADASAIAARLVAEGHGLVTLREQEVNLETAFLELTRGSLARPTHGP
jgi:ABC-2 type transport system ATP-binding protein